MFDKGSPIKLPSLLPILVLNSKGSGWKAHYVAEKIFFFLKDGTLIHESF